MTNSKRDIIMDAAEQLFAESGFSGTTTRAIAQKAGVNIAMLSYYFGSKEMLLYAVLERFSEELVEVFSDIEKNYSSPVERLRNWITAYIDYIFDHPNHARIVYRQVSVSQNKEDIKKLVSEFNKIRNIVLKALNDGMHSGDFNKIDAQLAITTITAPVNAIVLESNVMKHRLGIETTGEELYPPQFRVRVKKHMVQVFEALLIP